MAGNSVVNFPPLQPWDALGWTPGSDRMAGRRPDDREGERRTFANPLGLPCEVPSGSRSFRQHTRVRTLTRPTPRLVRGRAAPSTPQEGRADARHGASPAPRQEPSAPCTLACVASSPSASILGGPGADGPRGLPQAPPASSWGQVEEGRSPLGSPLPWGMAGDAAKRMALRRPQALSSLRCGKA